jgi:archaellum component FlaG (FlaF/FlaG flagellin family)
MGFSVTISHILMVIASVGLASGFSAYAIYAGSSIQSNVLQNVSDVKRQMSLQVQIVYATMNETTTPSHFVIYVKNIGWLPLTDFTYMDVYVGEYGTAVLYTYSEDAQQGSGNFTLIDADEDGLWEPRETAVIRAYPKTNVTGTVFEAKIFPFRGMSSSYLFPPPP